MNVELVVSPGVMDVARSRLAMRPIAGLPLLHIDKPQYQGAKRLQKRAFDFCFALAALTVACRYSSCTGLAIKLTSKGPVFYTSERIGIDGRPFPMLKFRTMVEDADNELANLLGTNEAMVCSSRCAMIRESLGSAGSCAGSASTSCRSSSTCFGRR